MACANKCINKEISIPYELSESEKGKYFIGQTPTFTVQNKNALAALVNPSNSRVNIYVNAITITNISQLSFSSEFYLRSNSPNGTVSDLFSCTNLAIVPPPIPNGQIQYLSNPTQPPSNGVSIFSRIVSPSSTLVVDGGQIIISPGQCLIVYLGGFIPVSIDEVIIAFGWSEEKIYNQCGGCYY